MPTDEVPRVENEMVIRSPPIHKDIAPTEKKFFTRDRMERYENQKTWKLSRVKTVTEDGATIHSCKKYNHTPDFCNRKQYKCARCIPFRTRKTILNVIQSIQQSITVGGQ